MIDYEETKITANNQVNGLASACEGKSNKGGAGVDDMDWAYLEKHQYTEIYKLWNRLTSGSYFPQVVKQVAIPKKGVSVSQKSKNAIVQKFRDMSIHKCRTTLEHIAVTINPVISGIINYYHKFRRGDMRNVWNGLNDRLLKWVRWEKRLRKEEAHAVHPLGIDGSMKVII